MSFELVAKVEDWVDKLKAELINIEQGLATELSAEASAIKQGFEDLFTKTPDSADASPEESQTPAP